MDAEPIARIAKVILDCRVILRCVALGNSCGNVFRCSFNNDDKWSQPIRPCGALLLTRGWAGSAPETRCVSFGFRPVNSPCAGARIIAPALPARYPYNASAPVADDRLISTQRASAGS